MRALMLLFLLSTTLALTDAQAAADDGTVRIPNHERMALPNGAVVLLVPQRDVPLVAFRAMLRGGAVADPADKQGLASLTAGLLEKGAGARDAFAFADAVADVGGSFSAGADVESIVVSGQFLARDRGLMIELLADALLRPRFDADRFEALRARQIEFIRAAKDSDPSNLIGIYGNAFLFGAHPYGKSVSGSEASLAALTREDVLAFYRNHFGGDRLVLVVAGDFDVAEMKKRVSAAFGGWRKAPATLAPVAPLPRQKGRRVLLVDSPGSVQTYFWIGNVGVARDFAQRPALNLVNTLFGGRFTSMLNSELRIKTGLTYGARARFDRNLEPGSFAIVSYTQTETTARAIDLALEIFGRLHGGGVADDALASARAYVLGQYPLALETATDWARAIGELEFYGLDRSYIEGYARDVRAVDTAATRKLVGEVYPASDDLVFVIIGDAERIRDEVKKYGPVTEMPISAPSFQPEH